MGGLQGTGFAKFLELRGYRVVERFGALWQSVECGIYRSLPFHLKLDLEKGAVREFIRAIPAAGVRYPSASQKGLPTGLYVCRDRNYARSCVQPILWHRMKRGLSACEVRRVTDYELLTSGLLLNVALRGRQDRLQPEYCDPGKWRRLVNAIDRCPCIVPVGAFVDGDMAAYAIVCLEDGWLHFLIQRSHYRYSEFFPRQVLEFTVAKHAALEGRVRACSLGLSTLDPDSGWDDMNSQLGFEWEPHSMVVRLHPALEPVVRSRLLGGVARRVAMSADGHGGGQEAGILLDAARRSRLAEAITAASRLAPSPDRRTRALLALNAAQQASVAQRRRLLLQAPAEAAMRNETHEDLVYWTQGG